MGFCYVSWQIDQYCDELGRSEALWEEYSESDQYQLDMAEWIAEAKAEEPDQPEPTEEDFWACGLDHYMERYVERMSEI